MGVQDPGRNLKSGPHTRIRVPAPLDRDFI